MKDAVLNAWGDVEGNGALTSGANRPHRRDVLLAGLGTAALSRFGFLQLLHAKDPKRPAPKQETLEKQLKANKEYVAITKQIAQLVEMEEWKKPEGRAKLQHLFNQARNTVFPDPDAFRALFYKNEETRSLYNELCNQDDTSRLKNNAPRPTTVAPYRGPARGLMRTLTELIGHPIQYYSAENPGNNVQITRSIPLSTALAMGCKALGSYPRPAGYPARGVGPGTPSFPSYHPYGLSFFFFGLYF